MEDVLLTAADWRQLRMLALAFVLSALVGLEREYRHKAAGLRTYTVVGLAAALFMLVSKYGFFDVLDAGRVTLDPSRVAAQVVSGIGFIGGGVIFMHRSVVRGLTTAASVWLTAALGMACGAGLPALAVATTAGHFIIMFGFPAIEARMPRARRAAAWVRVVYRDGDPDTLRRILLGCTGQRFAVDDVAAERAGGLVRLTMRVRGRTPVEELIQELARLEGVQNAGVVEEPEPA